MSEQATSPRPTRLRLDAARERVLLEVALALLAEVGYDRLSLDEVARRAHTSKATLYRRWPGKADSDRGRPRGAQGRRREPPGRSVPT